MNCPKGNNLALAPNPDWEGAIKVWDSTKMKSPKSEGDRQYNIAAGHEALAYKAYNATLNPNDALPFFEKAMAIYEKAKILDPVEKYRTTVFLPFDDKPDDVELMVVLAKTPGAAPEWVDKVKRSSKFATQLVALVQTGSKGIAADRDQTGGSTAPDANPTGMAPGVLAQRVKLSHAK
jgi:hypothetical protein